MRAAIRELYKIRLLTLRGLFHLIASVLAGGVNLMALLRYAAKRYPSAVAVIDDVEQLTYQQLYQQSNQLVGALRVDFGLTPGKRIAILCRNHAALVKALFAISRTGADMYLLNVDMSQSQFDSLVQRFGFDLVVYDTGMEDFLEGAHIITSRLPAYGAEKQSIDMLAKGCNTYQKLERCRSGRITVLTGGTTGDFKTAERKASMTNFIDPFTDLLVKLNLGAYRSVFVATPVYHGFGLATVFMGLMLGSRLHLSNGFDKRIACDIIRQHEVEVVTLVPLMLQRIMSEEVAALSSLKCIICGGAALSSSLAEHTAVSLGDVLYNLYGTSEAGVAIMALPEDLKAAPAALGRAIKGVSVKILDSDNREVISGSVGRLCISSRWAVGAANNKWIETGDLARADDAGYYYLCGKVDDMIVSGGENVYPIELENILIRHEAIKHVAVKGIADEDFGQRLKAYIVPQDACNIDQQELMNWLKGRAGRAQMPKTIEIISEMPFTALGKPDKKRL